MKPFQELIVIEQASSLAGAYCAKLFVDHGAMVFAVGRSTTMSPAQAAYVNAGKVIVEDDDKPDVRPDVVIESSAVEPLGPRPRYDDDVIHVRISPFGASGPYARWRGSDITDYALGGHLILYGDPKREPLRGPPNQPRYASGLFGFVGAMAALFARRTTGMGQAVDVSHAEVMAALHQFTLLRQTMGGDVLRRMGNRFTGQGLPNTIYPSADGWVCVSAPASDQVERLLDIAELSHLLDHPEISSPMDFQIKPWVLEDELRPWLAARPTAEIVELLQAVRVPSTPTSTMGDLLADPQLADRDYWRDVDDGSGHRVPGPPFRMSGHPWRSSSLPGEAVGAAGPPGSPASGDGDPVRVSADLEHVDEVGPLAGVRVLDLTRVWAGPLATRILAELGADVVMVEAPWSRGPRRLPGSMVETVKYFPGNEQGDEPWNRNGHLIKYSAGKRSLALDLSEPAGVAAFEKLVPSVDVVIENYSSRVMPQLGLDEHRLHELNADLIYVTMPGYGRSGPAEHWLAYGSSVDSHAGLSSLIGYRDQSPWKGGIAWPDPIAGLHATSALLIALWDREAGDREAGAGQTVECAQFEATVAVVGDQLLATQMASTPAANGGETGSGPGNRDADYAPQGVYPCMGDDRWVAMTVLDDEGWITLCELAGIVEETSPFFSLAERHTNHDQIDRLLAQWTIGFGQRELSLLLQDHGIAAAPVLDAPGVLSDPHFRDRHLLVDFHQPGVGSFVTPQLPLRLSATPGRVRRCAPKLGEHNHEVLSTLGGMTDDEIATLASQSIIATQPPE